MTRTPKKTTRAPAKKPTRAKATAKTGADAEKQDAQKPGEPAAGTGAADKAAATEVAPPPAPASADTSPAIEKSSGGGNAWVGAVAVILVLGVVIAGAVASRDVWWPYAETYLPKKTPVDDPRVAALEDRLGALEEKIQDADSGPAPESATFDDLEQARARLSAELATVIERLESVEKAVDSVERMATAMGSEDSNGEAQQSLQTLAGRVEKLEETADIAPVIAPVVERLDNLEELNRAVEESYTRETRLIEDVKRRIDSLEALRLDNGNASVSGASSLILAIGQLRATIRQGRAYAVELENVATVAARVPGAVDMLGVLQGYADTGVASRDTLRRSFDDTTIAIAQAENHLEGDGWMSQAVNRLADLVTVRRVDEDLAPDSVDARVARAEAHLAAGDLNAAVEMLDGLTDAAAVEAQPWLEQARATLAVEQALVDLNAHAISQLSAAQG